MSDRPVAAKLGLKSGFSVRLFAPGADWAGLLGSMPPDATVGHDGNGPSALDWRPVSQIALDDTWSALHSRPVADVKSARE